MRRISARRRDTLASGRAARIGCGRARARPRSCRRLPARRWSAACRVAASSRPPSSRAPAPAVAQPPARRRRRARASRRRRDGRERRGRAAGRAAAGAASAARREARLHPRSMSATKSGSGVGRISSRHVLKRLHRIPSSASRASGAAACPRSTRRSRARRPISSCESPPANLSATSSRSRGVEPRRARHGRPRGGGRRRPVRRRRRACTSSGSASSIGAALAAAQLVERGVAGDAEQPCLLGPARGAEASPLAVGALERLRRDLLRRGAVAQHRGDVSVHAREGRGGRGPRMPPTEWRLLARTWAGRSVPRLLHSCLNYAADRVSSRSVVSPSRTRCSR